MSRIWVSGAGVLLAFASHPDALAMGKKPPTPPAGPTTPVPVRKARLLPVGTKPFQLPNGSQVDLSADLNTMLATAVTQTPAFAVADPPAAGSGPADPCETHLEIRAAVSTLEMDVFSLGVTFGYSPSGSSSTITNLTGSADVKVGTIAMDFSVWECVAGNCSSVDAVTASSATAGVDLSMKIDFGAISIGPDLVYNTPLGNILRAIMNQGMTALAQSQRLNELSWSAVVREYLPETGTLIFDQGSQSRLAPNESFVIYAVTPAAGACPVYVPVAQAHTTRVDAVTSTAVVDQVLDPRGVQDGDLVMVRAVGSQQ